MPSIRIFGTLAGIGLASGLIAQKEKIKTKPMPTIAAKSVQNDAPLMDSNLPVLTSCENVTSLDLDLDLLSRNEASRHQQQLEDLKRCINKSREFVVSKLYESGSPGLVISVAVDGKVMWSHGNEEKYICIYFL